MATAPYFVLSPSTIVSMFGLLRGPDPVEPRPREDWQDKTVDVILPAHNEENYVVLCMASVVRQTWPPRKLILIDDGSRDRTVEFARSYAAEYDMNLEIIQRRASIGKTPTLKRQSREDDADVLLILDTDTTLESETYIERVVETLYEGAGVASACGTVLPLMGRDLDYFQNLLPIRLFKDRHPDVSFGESRGLLHRFNRGITNLYRDALYTYLQRFLYHGQMYSFGSIVNPVGCAVAYRREYLKNLFDRYEPEFGDDLTNSEDIFIGFAFTDFGYRNAQVMDVYARSLEPEFQFLPRQLYLWSSSFLQSCYYFDELLRSPFKAFKRLRSKRREQSSNPPPGVERRKAREPYRQPFGLDKTLQLGRPMGWVTLTYAMEKIFFPTAVLIMLILKLWEPLAVTLAAETIVSVGILTAVSNGRRLNMFFKGILVTPIRYASLLFDLVTITRFASDLWITRNRRWRK